MCGQCLLDVSQVLSLVIISQVFIPTLCEQPVLQAWLVLRLALQMCCAKVRTDSQSWPISSQTESFYVAEPQHVRIYRLRSRDSRKGCIKISGIVTTIPDFQHTISTAPHSISWAKGSIPDGMSNTPELTSNGVGRLSSNCEWKAFHEHENGITPQVSHTCLMFVRSMRHDHNFALDAALRSRRAC